MFEGKKVAIVGSGGGMRCVEGAGVRYRLAELGLSHPDIEVNVSGNVPNAAYAIGDQHHLGLKIWAEDLPSDPEFIRWDRQGEIISVDRMVDRQFTKRTPLNEDAMSHTDTRYFIATTDEATKRTKFFTNDDVQKGVKPLELIRAATALIGMTRKGPVEIQGKLYSDASPTTSLKSCIRVALEAGADLVVAIDSRTDVEREEFLPKFQASGWTDKVALLQPESKAVMVTTDPKELKQSFYAGFSAVSKHPLVQKLFGNFLATEHYGVATLAPKRS